MKTSHLLVAPVLALGLAWAPSFIVPAAAAQATSVLLGSDTTLAPKPHRVVTARLAVAPHRAAPVRHQATRPRPRHVVHHVIRPRTSRLTPVQRGAAAFASLRVALPAGWSIRFKPYVGRYQGISDSATRTVTIWVRARDSRQELRITIAHELGHVLDFTTLSPAGRNRYLQLRNGSSYTGAWYPANNTTDYAYPAGDFAEVYALWLAGPGDYRSTFAPRPDHSHLASIGQLFRELMARR